MSTLNDLRNNEEFKHCISAQVALSKTGEALECYTEGILKHVHQQVEQYVTAQGLPQCTKGCSQQLRKHLLNRWCSTCTAWRTQLETFHRFGHTVPWEKKHSMDWPKDYHNIAEVFTIPGKNIANVNLKDLSTILSIWSRCSVVPPAITALSEQLRETRNNLVHATLSLTFAKKTQVFQRIRALLNIPDVQNTIQTYNEVTKMLDDLEKGHLHSYEKEMDEALKKVQGSHSNMASQINIFKKEIMEGNKDLSSKIEHLQFIIIVSLCILTVGILMAMFTRTAFLDWCFTWTIEKKNIPRDENTGIIGVVDSKPLPTCDGLPIVTRKEWGARPSKSIDTMATPVSVVIIHHAAMGECTTLDRCAREARVIQNSHMDYNGWDDVGYGFMIGEDGGAYEGRGWNRVGAHTKFWNDVTISICFMGDYEDRLPSSAAIKTAKALLECGVHLVKITQDYKLYGHRDMRATKGPGQKLYELIQTWPHYDHNKPVKPSPIKYTRANTAAKLERTSEL